MSVPKNSLGRIPTFPPRRSQLPPPLSRKWTTGFGATTGGAPVPSVRLGKGRGVEPRQGRRPGPVVCEITFEAVTRSGASLDVCPDVRTNPWSCGYLLRPFPLLPHGLSPSFPSRYVPDQHQRWEDPLPSRTGRHLIGPSLITRLEVTTLLSPVSPRTLPFGTRPVIEPR